MQAQELLPLFNFPEFDHEFINKFVKEIPDIVHRVVTFEFDWGEFKKSRLFETSLEKRRRIMGDAVDDDWKNDAGKKATRIWGWWQSIVIDESIFPCFLSALRLVVILQVSSCTVERVFSQMKYALDFCGNVYEDHLEVRMFARLMGT